MTVATPGDRSVRRWLLATAVSVVATIAVGGATRLTESGLSITEWKPVSGVLPPLTEAGWIEAYNQYLRIPEAQTVHSGITLSQFKGLYWWEWAHRMVARLVGLVAALPFFVLWWTGRIRRTLLPRLASLPLLVGAQGVLGWYMVSSGLAVRTSVSQYRLVAHLGLALLIFAIAVWTAAATERTVNRPARDAPPDARSGARWTVGALLAAVFVTMLSGGFVAGLDAGRIFNEFPLMGGRLVPLGYGQIPGWRNLFENPVAAQFDHRLLATSVAIATWVAWWYAAGRWPGELRRRLAWASGVAAAQVGLGIATLLLAVPVPVAVAHQLGAVAFLTAMLVCGAEAFDARLP